MKDLKKQYQKYGTGLDESKEGDCWRTAIACILEVEAESVPHFVEEYDEDYLEETNKWLSNLDIGVVYIKNPEYPIYEDDHFEYVIKSGISKRGVLHAVVARSSDGYVVHDPYYDQSGLVSSDGCFALIYKE